MLSRSLFLSLALPLILPFAQGCRGSYGAQLASTDPESAGDDEMLSGPNGADEDLGGGLGGMGDDEFGDEEADDTAVPEVKRKKLPPRATPKKRCRGKGKKRKCTFHDPKPKVSAAYGVQTLLGNFGWGMTPKQVIKVLSSDVEKEYKERQKNARDAMAQDENRRWRKEQIEAIQANQIAFRDGLSGRWGVSLIQYEFEEGNEEEMVWVRSTTNLRKFYFFKDQELWKVFYAYSTDTWPGKSYNEVVEEKFKKWFGHSPKEHIKKDGEGREVVRYLEWGALGGEKIRAFDMTSVHGVIVLAVVDGKAEQRIGERLPNTGGKEKVDDKVGDVLGGSDVCYNSDGNIEKCAADDVRAH